MSLGNSGIPSLCSSCLGILSHHNGCCLGFWEGSWVPGCARTTLIFFAGCVLRTPHVWCHAKPFGKCRERGSAFSWLWRVYHSVGRKKVTWNQQINISSTAALGSQVTLSLASTPVLTLNSCVVLNTLLHISEPNSSSLKEEKKLLISRLYEKQAAYGC